MQATAIAGADQWVDAKAHLDSALTGLNALFLFSALPTASLQHALAPGDQEVRTEVGQTPHFLQQKPNDLVRVMTIFYLFTPSLAASLRCSSCSLAEFGAGLG